MDQQIHNYTSSVISVTFLPVAVPNDVAKSKGIFFDVTGVANGSVEITTETNRTTMITTNLTEIKG